MLQICSFQAHEIRISKLLIISGLLRRFTFSKRSNLRDVEPTMEHLAFPSFTVLVNGFGSVLDSGLLLFVEGPNSLRKIWFNCYEGAFAQYRKLSNALNCLHSTNPKI